MDEKQRLEQAIADFLDTCKVNARSLPAMRAMLEAAKAVGAAQERMRTTDSVLDVVRQTFDRGQGIAVDQVFEKKP